MASGSALNDLPSSAGSVSITITTAADCAWTAASNAPFAEIVSGGSGTGNGTVEVRISENSEAARTGSLLIAGSTLTLTQRASTAPPPPPPPPPSTCTFSVGPSNAAFDSAGGSTTILVRVTSGAGCAWTAVARDPFLSVVSGTSGSDNGQTTVTVAPNAGGARTGTLAIAGQTVSLTQAAGSVCVASVSPATQSIPALGGTGNITVAAQSNCAWAATTGDALISVPSAVKIGDGSVTFTLGRNSTPTARSGSVSVGGRSVSVTQPPAIEPALVFSFTSQPRDYIGGGQSRRFVYTSSSQFSATIDATRKNLSVRLNDGGWNVNLGAPGGGVLAPGLYNATARWPFHESYGTGPGLNVSGDGRGCNQSMGRFLIGELVVTDGAIQRLHAVVEQHCEYSSAALVGDIWIDAGGSTTVPPRSLPAPGSPTSILTMTGDAGDPRLNGQTRTTRFRAPPSGPMRKRVGW